MNSWLFLEVERTRECDESAASVFGVAERLRQLWAEDHDFERIATLVDFAMFCMEL